MNPVFRLVGLLVFALFVAGSLSAQPVPRSVSPSRQFLVYGTEADLRGALSDLAEQLKAHLLSVLRQSDDWKTPIVVYLQFPQANLPELPATALHFSQTGAGLKIQLDLVIGPKIDAPAVQRSLLNAILLERIYRHHSDLAAGSAYVSPPDWLVDGLLATRANFDRTPLVQAAATKEVPSLENFLRQQRDLLDSPAQLVFQGEALALVQMLLNGEQGPARLNRYIESLALASNDPVADLRALFPILSEADLARAWKASVAGLQSIQTADLLSFGETARRLDDALRLKVAGKPARVADLMGAKLSNSARAALLVCNQNLILLGLNANPLLRPVVTEYQEVTQLLEAGKRRQLRERLSRVETTRRRLVARMSEVDDYMNWFEATQLRSSSGAFNEYLRAASTPDQKPARRDPISIYLDTVEMQTGDPR